MSLSRTKQRQAILEAVQSTSEHPTASWVYQRVRRQIPRLSLGTVYRNLRLLREEGLLSEIRIGERAGRYEAVHQKHSHLYCRGCGRIQDLPILVDSDLEREAARLSGFSILEHSLEMWGVCPSCQSKPTGRRLFAAMRSAEASSGSRISRKLSEKRTKFSLPNKQRGPSMIGWGSQQMILRKNQKGTIENSKGREEKSWLE